MEWKKKVGDFVAQGEILALIETDKVTIEVTAETQGTIKEIIAAADSNVEVGQPLVSIEAGGEAPAQAEQGKEVKKEEDVKKAEPATAKTASAPSQGHEASQMVGLRATFARLARQRQGLPEPEGESKSAAPAAPSAAAPAPAAAKSGAKAPAAVSVGGGRTERRVPISPLRQRVVQRLKDSQNTAALLTTFQEADMSATLELRSKYQDLFKKRHGAPLGYLSVFAKASASALLEEPSVNAFIDDATNEIVYRSQVDLSVPIPTLRGPVSCVLRNVESKTIFELEHEIAKLMEKARKDQLTPDDMTAPTFGIVDTGSVGGMLGTGFINPPTSAVLGTNAVTKRAAAVKGKVLARPMMYLSLTYDHRLIDGREAVTFLCSVRDKVEDPSRLLLGL